MQESFGSCKVGTEEVEVPFSSAETVQQLSDSPTEDFTPLTLDMKHAQLPGSVREEEIPRYAHHFSVVCQQSLEGWGRR